MRPRSSSADNNVRQSLTSAPVYNYGTDSLKLEAKQFYHDRRDRFARLYDKHPVTVVAVAISICAVVFLVGMHRPQRSYWYYDYIREHDLSHHIVTPNVFVNLQSKSDICQLKPPLFLTPYIRENNVETGRQLSRVLNLPGDTRNLTSYSGFITVNESDFSNTFFWLFETTNSTVKSLKDVPLILYLDGGPGASSLDSLLTENGPIRIAKNGSLFYPPVSWTSLGDVLYIDNPVGVGFSFTDSDVGYSRNQMQVGWNLYNFLVQFYQLFPTYRKRPLYLTGESYAGKYVPALAFRIHEQNNLANQSLKIPLAGVAISGSWSDPENMYQAYGPLLYNMGLVDRVGEQTVTNFTNNILRLIRKGEFLEAHDEDDRFMSGAFAESRPTLFYNLTGFESTNTFLSSSVKADLYDPYLARCDVRNAIHVGNLSYKTDNEVLQMMREDVCNTVRHWLPTVYENYRTLIYTGQFDIIVGAPLVERFLSVLEGWRDREEYLNSKPVLWRVDPSDREIAGYVKQVGSQFYHAIVRGAGHLVAQDTPERCADLLYRFFYNQTF